jgi:hypothetical protein
MHFPFFEKTMELNEGCRPLPPAIVKVSVILLAKCLQGSNKEDIEIPLLHWHRYVQACNNGAGRAWNG